MIVAGTVLVLITWSVLAVIVVLAGTGPASLCLPHSASRERLLRTAIWWGFGLLLTMSAALSLVLPLESGGATLIAVAVIMAATIPGILVLRHRRPHAQPAGIAPSRSPFPPGMAALAAIGPAVAYLALKALGPASNYDTGLYHLGAIRYAAELGSVPGLANLFFPFGYSNSWFPAAALMGAGPWGEDGFRLLNGFVIVLVGLDLAFRLRSRRRHVGTTILSVGLLTALIPLVALADVWVTSPTSDTAVYLLTLVAVAYLADALSSDAEGAADAQVVLITTVVMASMRPTTLPFGLAAVTIVLTRVLLTRSQLDKRHAWLPAAIGTWALLFGAIQLGRDALLSGWLLYPLSLVRLDLPWTAPDPSAARIATLVNARDPYTRDPAATAQGWQWVLPWLHERVGQWETYFLAALLLMACVTALWMKSQRGVLPFRRMVLVVLPSAFAVLVWFAAGPPSYRFIWGPLFSIPIVIAGSCLSREDGSVRKLRQLVIGSLATFVVAVIAFSVMYRSQVDEISEPALWTLGPLSIGYARAPLPLPATSPYPTNSGLILQVRSDGNDQCWDNFPLCTPAPDPTLRLRGETLRDGFTRSEP